jgi:hypothetical protein
MPSRTAIASQYDIACRAAVISELIGGANAYYTGVAELVIRLNVILFARVVTKSAKASNKVILIATVTAPQCH